MKRQTQKAGSDTNKQNICGGKNSFLNRDLSESEAVGSSQQAPPLPAERGILCPRTVHSHCLVPGVITGDAPCLFLLLLDILVTLQAPLH